MEGAVRFLGSAVVPILAFETTYSAGGAGSAAAGASSLVLLAASYDGDDGKDGCREDDRRKHERDGKPRSRQRSKERVCRTLREYAVRKKLLHCGSLIR